MRVGTEIAFPFGLPRIPSSSRLAGMAGGGAATDQTQLDLLGRLTCPSSDVCVEQVPMMGGAQLTIFYSGRVHVYENVPPEKVNAIMLLLANGGSGGEHDRPSLSEERKTATRGGSSRASPPSSSSPILTSSFLISSQAQLMKLQPHHLVIQRSQAELPVARKASLARFLEKRADRTRAKVPTVVGLPCTSTAPP